MFFKRILYIACTVSQNGPTMVFYRLGFALCTAMIALAYSRPAQASQLDACQKLDNHTPYYLNTPHNVYGQLPQLVIGCNVLTSLRGTLLGLQGKKYGGSVQGILNIDLVVGRNITSKASGLFEALPFPLQSEIMRWQKKMHRMYLSLLFRLQRLNPLPGLGYFARARSPAYPFIEIETIDAQSYELRTFPYVDDLNLRVEEISKRSFGLGVILTLY